MPRPLPTARIKQASSGHRVCLLVLTILALWSRTSSAETRPLTYQLVSSGQVVGTRDIEIRYLPGRTSEVRLIQAWTNFKFTLGPTTYSFRQRLGGRLGGSRSFSSYIDDNGRVREIQGQLSSAGTWTVTIVQDGRARIWHLDARDVDLTSLELLDPRLARRVLEQTDYLRVLATETGAILEGPLQKLGSAQEKIGGQSTTVQRYRWSPPSGEMTLSYSSDGFLVSYDVSIAGHLLSANLNALPPPRTYGDLEQPILGEVVVEEPL